MAVESPRSRFATRAERFLSPSGNPRSITRVNPSMTVFKSFFLRGPLRPSQRDNPSQRVVIPCSRIRRKKLEAASSGFLWFPDLVQKGSIFVTRICWG